MSEDRERADKIFAFIIGVPQEEVSYNEGTKPVYELIEAEFAAVRAERDEELVAAARDLLNDLQEGITTRFKITCGNCKHAPDGLWPNETFDCYPPDDTEKIETWEDAKPTEVGCGLNYIPKNWDARERLAALVEGVGK